MSRPHIIVAAVHEPENSLQNWWQNNKDVVEDFELVHDHKDDVEWRFCEGMFRSSVALERFPVRAAYHRDRGEDVIEVVLSDEDRIESTQMTALEDILDEINSAFETEFTLEVYYWYDGVDKPGGVSESN